LDEQFSKQVFWGKKKSKKNPPEILEANTSVIQIKNSIESNTNIRSGGKKRVSGIEDQVDELLHSDSSKEKKRLSYHNI
jgi:hypothetical protein